MSVVDAATRAIIEECASFRCEYCRLPVRGQDATFPIDHPVPPKCRRRNRSRKPCTRLPALERTVGYRSPDDYSSMIAVMAYGLLAT